MSGRVMPGVRATEAARAALRSLTQELGPLVVIQSAGCCDGSVPIVLPEGEFPLGDHDIRVGRIDGTPVYVPERDLDAWAHGDLEIDIADGYPDGFSLAPAEARHFTCTPDACARFSPETGATATP